MVFSTYTLINIRESIAQKNWNMTAAKLKKKKLQDEVEISAVIDM